MAQLGPLALATATRRSEAHSKLNEGYKIALQNGLYVEQDNICRADFDNPAVKQALGSVGLSKPFHVLVNEDGNMPNGQKATKLHYCDYKGAFDRSWETITCTDKSTQHAATIHQCSNDLAGQPSWSYDRLWKSYGWLSVNRLSCSCLHYRLMAFLPAVVATAGWGRLSAMPLPTTEYPACDTQWHAHNHPFLNKPHRCPCVLVSSLTKHSWQQRQLMNNCGCTAAGVGCGLPFSSPQEKTDHVNNVSDEFGMLPCREKQLQKKKHVPPQPGASTEQAQATSPAADPVAG
jgi:hypothetical protein